MLTYQDKIYSTINIEEPLIQELCNSEVMARLKKVNQYGASFYRFSHLTTSRFEHCVGVYFLLKKFGASLEEQAAGLLHDVPHTVFSHVIDFVFGGGEGTSFHEQFHEYFLHDSDVIKILEQYKIDWHKIYNTQNYLLLERDAPDLCMDRVDYFFRDMFIDNYLKLEEINLILNNIIVKDGNIAFQNIKIAKFAAEKFREGNDRLWGNPLQATLYHIFAEVIKIALFDNIITFRDLFTTDDLVYNKLINSKQPSIIKRLELVNNLKVTENKNNFDYHVKSKIRIIDPYILTDNKLARLSVLDPVFHKNNQDYLASRREGFYVKII